MSIACGIASALFHRERTGKAVELDVSLMSTGWWAAGSGIDLAIENRKPFRVGMPKSGSSMGNPLIGSYKTSDGGIIVLNMVTPGPYIRDTFQHLGISECADDPRFSTVEALMQNWEAASATVRDAIAKQPFAYWRNHLRTLKGQWAPAQSILELVKWLPAAQGHEGTLLGFGRHDRGALHGRYLVMRQWLDGHSVELELPGSVATAGAGADQRRQDAFLRAARQE